jgi:hypothetical protein
MHLLRLDAGEKKRVPGNRNMDKGYAVRQGRESGQEPDAGSADRLRPGDDGGGGGNGGTAVRRATTAGDDGGNGGTA